MPTQILSRACTKPSCRKCQCFCLPIKWYPKEWCWTLLRWWCLPLIKGKYLVYIKKHNYSIDFLQKFVRNVPLASSNNIQGKQLIMPMPKPVKILPTANKLQAGYVEPIILPKYIYSFVLLGLTRRPQRPQIRQRKYLQPRPLLNRKQDWCRRIKRFWLLKPMPRQLSFVLIGKGEHTFVLFVHCCLLLCLSRLVKVQEVPKPAAPAKPAAAPISR